jgi:hypothetical protein
VGPKGDAGNDGVTDPNVLILATRAELQAVVPDPAKIVLLDNDVWTYTNDPRDLAAATEDAAGYVYVRPLGQALPAWRRRVTRYTPEHFGGLGYATAADALAAGNSATQAIQRAIAIGALDQTPFHFPPRTYALDAPVDLEADTDITADSTALVCALSGADVAFRVLRDTPVQLPSINGFASAAIEIGSIGTSVVSPTVAAYDITSCGVGVRSIGVIHGSIAVRFVTAVTTAATFEDETRDTVISAHAIDSATQVVLFPDNTIAAMQGLNSFRARSATNVEALIRCVDPGIVGGRFSAVIDEQLLFTDPLAANTRLVQGKFNGLRIEAIVVDLKRHHIESSPRDEFEALLTPLDAGPALEASSSINLTADALYSTLVRAEVVAPAAIATGETLTAYIQHVLGGARWTVACASPLAVAASISDVGDNSSVRIDVTNVGTAPIAIGARVKLILSRV